jgi:hypothetical protein
MISNNRGGWKRQECLELTSRPARLIQKCRGREVRQERQCQCFVLRAKGPSPVCLQLLEVAKIHRPARTQIERLMLDFIFRAVNWDFGVFLSANDAVVPVADSERTSCEAVDAVEVACCYSRIRRTDCN